MLRRLKWIAVPPYRSRRNDNQYCAFLPKIGLSNVQFRLQSLSKSCIRRVKKRRVQIRVHVRDLHSSGATEGNGFDFAEVRKILEEMGKRKAKRKAPTKKKNLEPLDKQFNCPFCNHEKSCEVNLDKERNVGFISCRVCLEDFQTTINYLSEEVDVYSDWIDACETANQ